MKKEKKEKNKGKTSGIIIGTVAAAIIIGVVLVQFSLFNEGTSNQDDADVTPQIIDTDKDGIPDDVDPYVADMRTWPTSGPFQIDRTKYILGENIFIRVGALSPSDKGQIEFLRPLNQTHAEVYIKIPFDGSAKNTFNQYFKPSLSEPAGICTKEDLIGEWIMTFPNTNYESISFNIIDKVLPGEESAYEVNVC